MKAICIGHSTYDITLPVEDFPIENSKIRTNKIVECGGGPASNAAYLLSKWHVDTTIASIIGKDYYGNKIKEEYKEIGINTKYLEEQEDYETSSSYIIASKNNGTRTVITHKKQSIKKLNKDINEKYDLVLVDGEHPETAIDVLINNLESITILDAGRLSNDTKKIGKMVKYLITSKKFAEEFINKEINSKSIEELISAHKILEEYFKNNVIITLEEEGSFTKYNNEYIKIPSIKENELDTTGAGDIFHGAFAYFILNNYSYIDSITHASVAGALSVKKIGSRNSIPKLTEVLDYDLII